MITLVVATESNNGIGLNNTMPWHSPTDLKQFKAFTMGKLVVMGYRTWSAITQGLSGREMLILSRQKRQQLKLQNVTSVTSVEECLAIYKNSNKDMIIGGGSQVYCLFMPWVDQVRWTTFNFTTRCDTFFCDLDKEVWKKKECWRNEEMEVVMWKREKKEE